MVAVVAEIHEGPANALWSRFGREPAITGDQFFTYLNGAERPRVIRLSGARQLRAPLTLAEMRSHVRGFQPPQFFKRLEPGGQELALLEPLAECADGLPRSNGQQAARMKKGALWKSTCQPT